MPYPDINQRIAPRQGKSLLQNVLPISDGLNDTLATAGHNFFSGKSTTDDLASKIALLNYKAGLASSELPTEMPKGFVKIGNRVFKDPSYQKPEKPSITGADGQPINYDVAGPEFLKQLGPEDQNTVKGILDYKIDPIHTFGGMKGGQRREHMLALASQVDPEFDSSQYNARYKYNQDLSSGKVAQNVRSLNTATKHLQSLDESMGKVASGPFPILNKVQNWWQRNNGNPAQSEVDTALQAVAGELATVFKNSSGTDQEIGHWLKTFDPNASLAQKKAFVNTAIELMQGRLGAMEDQYTSTMGHEAPANTFISPTSMEIMNRLKGSSGPSFLNGVGQKTDYKSKYGLQ